MSEARRERRQAPISSNPQGCSLAHKTSLISAAWGAIRTKNSYLRAQFARLKARRGAKKAIVAVAASMLTAAFYILRDGVTYRDLGGDHFTRRNPRQTAKRLIKRLESLGFAIEARPTTALFQSSERADALPRTEAGALHAAYACVELGGSFLIVRMAATAYLSDVGSDVVAAHRKSPSPFAVAVAKEDSRRKTAYKAAMTTTDASDFGFADQLEVGREAENYTRWIAEQFAPFMGRRVMEVGCGIGNMSKLWIDRDAFVGIDPEAACVEKCKARFARESRAQFFHDHVGAPDWTTRWTVHRPDTIVAVNVLEHIREDLAALRGWRDILRKSGGGHLCLFVPAFEFAYSEFDKRYGHYRRYTKDTLRDKILDAGLELRVLRYFNMPGLLGWWSTFVLLKRGDAVPGQIGLYDKVVVPLARRIERHVPPPFGNSVVAVARV